MTKSCFHKLYYKIISFSLIGGIITILSILVSTFLLKVVRTPLYPTYIIVYISTIGLSYVLNAKITFKAKKTIKSVFLYYLTYGLSFLLGLGLLFLFRENLKWDNYVIGLLPIPFTFAFNYIVSHFIFKKNEKLEKK